MSSLVKSSGYLGLDDENCVVSFSASLGQYNWNGLIGEEGEPKQFNTCCIWTGDDQSPPKDWFVPWVDKVGEAVGLKKKLIVVGERVAENEPGTLRVENYHGKMEWMRLGHGQKLEIEYLNRKGSPYYYCAIGGGNNRIGRRFIIIGICASMPGPINVNYETELDELLGRCYSTVQHADVAVDVSTDVAVDVSADVAVDVSKVSTVGCCILL